MTNQDSNQPKVASRWPMLLLIGAVALLAGVGANYMLGQSGSVESAEKQAEQELMALQEQLIATTALPVDFKKVPAFSLLGPNGDEVTDSILDDTWTMVFFGFTHCPDICPTTLYVMNSVLDELQERSLPALQVVFITVDPVRDTIDKVTDYVAYFGEDFLGLSGTLNNINQLTSSLGVVASFTASTTDPNDYTVDHTASMLLIDPQKNVRAKFGQPHEVDSIVNDYATLMNAFAK